MIHVADGYPQDDWNRGYYMRPVFHCQRCYKYFVHNGDVDPTCQQVALPVLGPWFIVGPATVKFVLSVSKMIENQLDVSRSRILTGGHSHRSPHEFTLQDIRAGGLPVPKGLRLTKKPQEKGFKNLNVEVDDTSSVINFTAVESKIFNIEKVLETPSMAALKELAFRGVPAYEDNNKNTLYTDRNRVEMTGEVGHRRYHGLPKIVKHFLSPRERENLVASPASEFSAPEVPAISVDPSELYKGLSEEQLIEVRDRMSVRSADTLLSQRLDSLTEDLLKAELQTTETHEQALRADSIPSTLHITPTTFSRSASPRTSVGRSSRSTPNSDRDIRSPSTKRSPSTEITTHKRSELGVSVEGTSLQHSPDKQRLSSQTLSMKLKVSGTELVDVPPISPQGASQSPRKLSSQLTPQSASQPTPQPTLQPAYNSKNLNQTEWGTAPLLVGKADMHKHVIPTKPDVVSKKWQRAARAGKVSPADIKALQLDSGAEDKPSLLQALRFAQSMAKSSRKPTKALSKNNFNKLISLVKAMKPGNLQLDNVGRSQSMGNIFCKSRGEEMDTWFGAYAVSQSTRRNSETDLHGQRVLQEHMDMVSDNISEAPEVDDKEETCQPVVAPKRLFKSHSMSNQLLMLPAAESIDVSTRGSTQSVELPSLEQTKAGEKVDSLILLRRRGLSLAKQQLLAMAKKLDENRKWKKGSLAPKYSLGRTPLSHSPLGSFSLAATQIPLYRRPSRKESNVKDVFEEEAAREDESVERFYADEDEIEKEEDEISSARLSMVKVTAAKLLVDTINLVLKTAGRTPELNLLDPRPPTYSNLIATEKLRQLQSAQNATTYLESIKLELIKTLAQLKLEHLNSIPPESKSQAKAVTNTTAILDHYAQPTATDAISSIQEKVLSLDEELTRQGVEQMEVILDLSQMPEDGVITREEALRLIAEVGEDRGLDKLTYADFESLQTTTEQLYGSLLLPYQYRSAEDFKDTIALKLMWELSTDDSMGNAEMTQKLFTRPSHSQVAGASAAALIQEKMSSEKYAVRRPIIEKERLAAQDARDKNKRIAEANRDIIAGINQATALLRKELRKSKGAAKRVFLQSFLAKKTRETLNRKKLNQLHGNIDFESRIQRFVVLHPTVRSYLMDEDFIALVEALGRDASTLPEEDLQIFIDINKLIKQRAEAENEGVMTSMKMLSMKGVAELVVKEAKSSKTAPASMVPFAHMALSKRRLVDTLGDSIMRKVKTVTSSSASDNLLKHLLAMSKFKYMIAVMGVNPVRLRNEVHMQDMVKFYNFMYTWDIDLTTLDAGTLWELKALSIIVVKMDDEVEMDTGKAQEMYMKDMLGFHGMLKAIGRRISMMPKRILHLYYDFYKQMGRYGITTKYCENAEREEIIDWYMFHRRLQSDYSRVLNVDSMGYEELMDLKHTYDIHTQFEVFTEDSMSEEVLRGWMRFSQTLRRMYGESLEDMPSFTEEEKRKLVEIVGEIEAADPTLLTTLTDEQLKTVMRDLLAGNTDVKEMLRVRGISKLKLTPPVPTIVEPNQSLDSLHTFVDQLDIDKELDMAVGLLGPPISIRHNSADIRANKTLIQFFKDKLHIEVNKSVGDEASLKLNNLYDIVSVIRGRLSQNEADELCNEIDNLCEGDVERMISLTRDNIFDIVRQMVSEEKLSDLKNSIKNLSITSTFLSSESQDTLKDLRPAAVYDSSQAGGVAKYALKLDVNKSKVTFKTSSRSSRERMMIVKGAEKFPVNVTEQLNNLMDTHKTGSITSSIDAEDDVEDNAEDDAEVLQDKDSTFTDQSSKEKQSLSKMSVAQLKGLRKLAASQSETASKTIFSDQPKPKLLTVEAQYQADLAPSMRVVTGIPDVSTLDTLSSAEKIQRMIMTEPTEQYIEEMGLTMYGEVLTGLRKLSDTEKRDILKDLINIKVNADGLMTGMAKKRWKLLRAIIKMIEELKMLHEDAVKSIPGRSEVNVWTSLIMAEKNGKLWKKLREALQRAEFEHLELAKFSLLVGIPQGALEAILDEDKKKSRLSVVSAALLPHTSSNLLMNLADSSTSLQSRKGENKTKTKVAAKKSATGSRGSRSNISNAVKDKPRRSFKGVPLGAKVGLANKSDPGLSPAKTKSMGIFLPKVISKWKRNAIVNVEKQRSVDITRRHSTALTADDENVTHERRLTLLAAERRRALKADLNLKKFSAYRSQSVDTEDSGRRHVYRSKTPTGHQEKENRDDAADKNQYKGFSVTFKSSPDRSRDDLSVSDSPRMSQILAKLKMIAHLSGRFTAARLAARHQDDPQKVEEKTTPRKNSVGHKKSRRKSKRRLRKSRQDSMKSNVTAASDSIGSYSTIHVKEGAAEDDSLPSKDDLHVRERVFELDDSFVGSTTTAAIENSVSSSSFKIESTQDQSIEPVVLPKRMSSKISEPKKTLGVVLQPARHSSETLRSAILRPFTNRDRIKTLGESKHTFGEVPKIQLPAIDIGQDDYSDTVTPTIIPKLPPITKSSLVQINSSSFDEQADVINKIANGDFSSEIITTLISIVGIQGIKPVTRKNRRAIAQKLLNAALRLPVKNGAIVAAVVELVNNIDEAEKKLARKVSKYRKKRSNRYSRSTTRVENSSNHTLDTNLALPKLTVKKKAKESSVRRLRNKSPHVSNSQAFRPSRAPITRTAKSFFETKHSMDDESSRHSSQQPMFGLVARNAMAVDQARRKLLKSMMPVNKRKLKSKQNVISSNISPSRISFKARKTPNDQSETDMSDQNFFRDDFPITDDWSKTEMNELVIPNLPRYEEKMKSRIGIKQGKMMASSGAGGRQVSDLIRLAKEEDNVVNIQPAAAPKSKFIWVYEWDLYEPYFTRNWTFTYHLPVPGFKQKMIKVAEDSKSLGKWLPSLTNIPELPAISDKSK